MMSTKQCISPEKTGRKAFGLVSGILYVDVTGLKEGKIAFIPSGFYKREILGRFYSYYFSSLFFTAKGLLDSLVDGA